ncbi:unnamed protein product [Dibothriocephalus latus]|uniref:Uncharacterized protein n=1 Tax=Dibothriocephalus latus TaxID=60516 RepID=A0A3P7LG82_DIBLA|nr:unnamed protein product [Dibothriocephalus latus]
MDSGSYSLPPTTNVMSTSSNEQKRPVPGSTTRKVGGGGPLSFDTPEPFLFEGPEGQVPTSVLATGVGDPTRLDSSIAAGLSMSSNFAGSSSVAKGATMQEFLIQVGSEKRNGSSVKKQNAPILSVKATSTSVANDDIHQMPQGWAGAEG